jgi:CelD/BcsL family acetyltransferase involved in cellulose biosynthesis
MEFTHLSEFTDDLKKEWKSLADTGITKVPFLRFEYLKTWWQTRGGGEWPESAQLVIIRAHEAGKLVGIAPCFVAEHEGKRSLLFLGSVEISDYLDLIVNAQQVEEFTNNLLTYIKGTLATEYQISTLDLQNILESSPSVHALEQAAMANGLACEIHPITRAPYIPLSGDYEEYMASLDKKQRHEMRRKVRRLMEQPVPSEWYIASDPATIETEIEDFIGLMAFDP